MSRSGHDWSGSVDTGGSLSPVEARRDAADRLVGQRTLLALRIAMIVTVIIFTICGILVDPDIVGIKSRSLGAATAAVWVLPSVTALVAVVLCRRPARRQTFLLVASSNIAAVMGVVMGGVGVAAGLYGSPPAFVLICGVALASGLATLVLQYAFRVRRVR
ncbi:MAG: hypothetical protein ACRDRW_11485 [Pseudonocardiaceae bacterium]